MKPIIYFVLFEILSLLVAGGTILAIKRAYKKNDSSSKAFMITVGVAIASNMLAVLLAAFSPNQIRLPMIFQWLMNMLCFPILSGIYFEKVFRDPKATTLVQHPYDRTLMIIISLPVFWLASFVGLTKAVLFR